MYLARFAATGYMKSRERDYDLIYVMKDYILTHYS